MRYRTRYRGALTAALIVTSAVAPAQAGVGLPEIGVLEIGSHQARILNDSRSLRRGANTLTVHIPSLPGDRTATLRLHGPQGEVVDVALRPLRVLGGGARHGNGDHGDGAGGHITHAAHGAHGAHGVHGHGSGSDDARGDAHEAHGAGGHGGERLEGYAVRGAARVPTTGVWRAVLTVGDGHGETTTAELSVDAVEEGPSAVYLGFMGLLIGGSVLYGSIQRLRDGRRR